MGHSAGGQLALCLAAHAESIHHAISLAGVVDLNRAWQLHLSHDAVAEFLGGPPDQAADHYREADPMQLNVKAEQWLIHGGGDQVVPPDFSRRYSDSKKNKRERVHLIEVDKADHFDLIDPRSPAWVVVARSAVECLSS